MTKIELTDQEAEEFKEFCEYKQKLSAEDERWKQLRAYCKQVGYGEITIALKDGLPFKISKTTQTIILGIIP